MFDGAVSTAILNYFMTHALALTQVVKVSLRNER